MSTDKTAAIVMCSKYVVKVNDRFKELEDNSLTKITQLQKHLSKTMQFFHRGKPKSDSSRICTNIRQHNH